MPQENFVLFVDGAPVPLTYDMHEYLKLEAKRLDITEEEVYKREQAAAEQVRNEMPDNNRLLRLADQSPPPPEWFDEKEDLFN